MPFQPLTPEQYQKARDAGFSADQIVQNEQRRKSDSIAQTASATPSPVPGEGFLKSTGNDLANRVGQEGKVISDTFTGKISPVSGIVQTLGTGAGAVGDVAMEGIKGLYNGLIPESVRNPINSIVGGIVGNAASSPAGQGLMKMYGDFKNAQPELVGDLEAVGNVAGVLPIGRGLGIAKDIAKESLGKGALANTIEMITPELGSKAAASNIAKQGTVKTGFLGKITTAPDPYLKKVAQTVMDNMPDFHKLASFSDRVNETRKSVYLLANQLKNDVIASGKDVIYPFKELSSAMGAVEKPIQIRADKVLERQFELARNAALKFAQESGGTVSGLFDARKAFDRLIEEQFPTLYERANAPMRGAITSMRNVMNDFIEKKLPAGADFKKRLKTQSHLYSAIDAMAPKVVKELGSSSFGVRHPIISSLAKKGAAVAAGGLLGGLGFQEGQKLLGGD